MSDQLPPAEVLKRLYGGSIEPAAEAIGMHPKTGYKWLRAFKRRPPGYLSADAQRRFADLVVAGTAPEGLTLEHLIRGADEAEIDAILAEREQQPEEAAA